MTPVCSKALKPERMEIVLQLLMLMLLAKSLPTKGQDGEAKYSNVRSDGQLEFRLKGVTEPKLPRHLKPEFYKLRIAPFLEEGNFTFSGQVDIDIRVLEDNAKNVTLHSHGLRILKATLVQQDETLLPIAHMIEVKDKQWLILLTQDTLPKDAKITLTIVFEGHLRNDSLGFFYQSYKDPVTDEVKYLAATQFQDVYARTAFPCFDDPSLKAQFKVSIGRKKTMRTLTNAANHVTASPDDDGDYVFDNYAKTPLMSTYLLAFVISSFKCSEPQQSNSGVLVRVCSKDMGPTTTNLAQSLAPRMLDFFEETLRISYPLEKLDLVALPEFSVDGMENWGLIIVPETVLNSSKVITHEVAHQWFGNYVTMKWWNE